MNDLAPAIHALAMEDGIHRCGLGRIAPGGAAPGGAECGRFLPAT
jgi:hypothetical protein